MKQQTLSASQVTVEDILEANTEQPARVLKVDSKVVWMATGVSPEYLPPRGQVQYSHKGTNYLVGFRGKAVYVEPLRRELRQKIGGE